MGAVCSSGEDAIMKGPTFDLLLEYLRTLGHGAWPGFKAAVSTVGATFYEKDDLPRWLAMTVAENLTSLGHLEMAFDTTLDWIVAPPTLVGSSVLQTGIAFLCGSRTSKF